MKRIVYWILILLILILLVLFTNNIFSQLKQRNMEMQQSHDEAIAYKAQAYIMERFYSASQDTLFVASFLNENLEGKDPSEETVKAYLEEIIPNLYDSTDLYKQITYLDREGNEKFVMDGSGFHRPSVPANRSKKEYFSAVQRQTKGTVHAYFDGSSLYVSYPVNLEDNSFFGAVVVTLQKERLLKEIQGSLQKENILLIEDTGKYILSPTPRGKGSFADDYSQELFQHILTTQTGYREDKQGLLFTYVPLALDDHQWFLIVRADKNVVTAWTSSLHRNILYVISAAFLGLMVLMVMWMLAYRKALRAEQLGRQKTELEKVNTQLMDKQQELEKQNRLVEDLNVQLAKESVRYQRQKDTLQAITDSIESGIAMVDSLGKVIFMNRSFMTEFNVISLDQDRVIRSDELFRGMVSGGLNEGKNYKELQRTLTDLSKSYTFEVEKEKPSQGYYRIHSLPCIASDRQVLGRIFLYIDITHQKEVDRLKSELISTVSHELRTPMSSIVGFSELLLTRNLSPERTKGYMEIIHSESQRLTKLINDFLDIQRMESGRQEFKKEYLSLDKIISEAVELFQNGDGKHHILYPKGTMDIPQIFGDPDKLIQVMSNLLSNAIKYSPQGGDILVSVERKGGKVQVSVTDQGLGIPDNVKDKLFTKFFRVDNDDRREIGGTGLGLAICKEIISAHGGTIGVHSQYGEGSTFYFMLPLENADHVSFEDDKASKPARGSKGNTVLLVEDDSSLVRLFVDVLKDDGFDLYVVNNGEDALKLISEEDFSLIILDIRLKGSLTGWDVLKELKEEGKTEKIPVIISSIYENSQQEMAKEASDYLVKPFDSQRLLEVVHKAVKDDLNAKMMMHGSETLRESIVNALEQKGIRVKEIRQNGDILIISLNGGEEDETVG